MSRKQDGERAEEAPSNFAEMFARKTAALAKTDVLALAPEPAEEPATDRSEAITKASAPLSASVASDTPAASPANAARPKKAKGDKPHYLDHRDRLRDKFARRGADAFDDYELLELILFQCLPRIDTKPIAKTLIKTFGNLAEVVSAPVEQLTMVNGIGPAAAQHLKLLQQVSLRIGQSSLLNRPVLSSWNALLDYCRAVMQFEGREQFRVLFLDKKNRLIADEIMSQGTVDRAPVYPREIVRRALVHESTAIILAHNHPSGDPTPSPQDVELTNAIVDTCRSINVVVHDHLVVGREDVSSFKMLGLL